jgi:hypothetical protein
VHDKSPIAPLLFPHTSGRRDPSDHLLLGPTHIRIDIDAPKILSCEGFSVPESHPTRNRVTNESDPRTARCGR